MTPAAELPEQQINLLSAELLPRRVPLPVRYMAGLLALTGVVMALLATQAQLKTKHLREASAVLAGQQQQLNQQLARLASTITPPEPDPALQASALVLEKRLAHQRTLLSQLDAVARTSELAPWLLQLAEQRPAGLWLDELHRARQGTDQWISGWVRDPADLTRWTEQLTKASTAGPVGYQRLVLERQAQGGFRFVLAAGCLSAASTPAAGAAVTAAPSRITSGQGATTSCLEQRP